MLKPVARLKPHFDAMTNTSICQIPLLLNYSSAQDARVTTNYNSKEQKEGGGGKPPQTPQQKKPGPPPLLRARPPRAGERRCACPCPGTAFPSLRHKLPAEVAGTKAPTPPPSRKGSPRLGPVRRRQARRQPGREQGPRERGVGSAGRLPRTYPLVGLGAEAVERYLAGHVGDAGDIGVVLLQSRQADVLPRSAHRLHLGSRQPLAGEGKKQPCGVTGAPVPAAGRNAERGAYRSAPGKGCAETGARKPEPRALVSQLRCPTPCWATGARCSLPPLVLRLAQGCRLSFTHRRRRGFGGLVAQGRETLGSGGAEIQLRGVRRDLTPCPLVQLCHHQLQGLAKPRSELA